MNPDTLAATTPPPAARVVEAGRGLAWWSEAWALFMRMPWLWIAMALIALLGFVLVSFVPLLGSIAASLALPVLAGGWVQAARKVARGEPAEIGDLFACFRDDRLTPLVVQGAVLAVATLAIFAIAAALGAGAMFGLMSGGWGGGPHHGGGMLVAAGAGLTAMLVVLLVGLLTTAALWFAPALVVFHRVPPIEALQASFAAALKNALPFLVYGAVQLVLALVASALFGLGWIVLAPVLGLTMYTAYADVFEPREALPAP